MPDVYATAPWAARPPGLAPGRPRARPAPRAFLRAHATAGGRAGARCRLRADRPARARADARHHRRRPDRASRLSRAVRASRRVRGTAVRRRGVRARVLLERDRARSTGPPGGIRGGDPSRGARLVRADPRVVVPGRAPRAAARRPLAAAEATPSLLEAGSDRRVGRHLAAQARRDGGAVRTRKRRARRAAGEELGAASTRQCD